MENTIGIFNVKWSSYDAGPSPDGKRTELFLAGCQRAVEGNPCSGCFNPALWSFESYCDKATIEKAFNNILKYASNKYITFVGGEPLDQYDALIELCERLHGAGFHILVITHYTLWDVCEMIKDSNKSLFDYIDILIDGEYDKYQRIFNEDKKDNVHNVIGSANQVVYDIKKHRDSLRDKTYLELKSFGKNAGSLEEMHLDSNNDLVFTLKGRVEDEKKVFI